MKRSWIGAGLLAVLLVFSLGVTWMMDTIHRPVAEDLHRAALAEDWETAVVFADSAEAGWKKWHHLRSCFADHTPVEEIDAQFARFQGCSREEFPSLAAETEEMVKAMGSSHGLTWWNFF